jgi:membrane protein
VTEPQIDQTPTEEPPEPTMKARGEAWRARGLAMRESLEGQRPEHASVEIAFRWLVRDKEIAGGVLGGGLAYRFFFWVLALTVLLAGGLGFASASGTNVEVDAEDAGVTGSLASTIATAAQQSETGRWWLVISGTALVLWFSFGLLRALRLVHAAAWRVPAPPFRNLPKAIAFVIAAPLVLLAASAFSGWVRANAADPVGVLVTLGLGVCFGAVWLWVSMSLPSKEVPWTAYLPGAILFGVGVEALYVFTAYYLQIKLANASELYGALGLATTALFYLFLIGRGVIWAAELNAVTWEVRTERRASPE